MDEEDTVEREYPVYASTVDKIFSKHEPQRLTLLEFPQRPPWRPYETGQAESVQYKPGHSMMQMKVPQQGADDGYINLSGQGGEHEAMPCVMVKVDGAFVLFAVDEIIQMRPEMSRFNATCSKSAEADRDPDYKPSIVKKEEKPSMRQLQVEVTKRETDRQVEMRMRSHAYMREQQDAEPWQHLRMHPQADKADTVLMAACRAVLTPSALWLSIDSAADPEIQVMSGHPEGMKMDMPAAAYLEMISPSTWISDDLALASGANDNAAAAPKPVAATELSAEDLTAVTASVSALFAAHSVVSLDNVRTWLKTYSAKPAAAKAASLSDAALRGLLLRESVLEVKGRFVLAATGNDTSDPFRKLVLELLQATEDGIKKADVMGAAKLQDMEISEHLYNKVLKDLCVAHGALWNLRPGSSF